jgi:hypothetical protein
LDKTFTGASFLLRNDHEAFEPGRFKLDPSTIPDSQPGAKETAAAYLWRGFTHLVPYKIGFNVTEGGMSFGYKPSYRISKNWELGFPLEPYSYSGGRDKRFLGGGATISWYAPYSFTVGAGPFYMAEWIGPTMAESYHEPGVRAEIGILWGKITLEYTLRRMSEPGNNYLSLNFNDVNGILYWVFRLGRY